MLRVACCELRYGLLSNSLIRADRGHFVDVQNGCVTSYAHVRDTGNGTLTGNMCGAWGLIFFRNLTEQISPRFRAPGVLSTVLRGFQD